MLRRNVHGADVTAGRSIVPEAAGLYAVAHGFALLLGEHDQEKLRLETPVYDALYAWCRRQVEKAAEEPVRSE